MNHRAVFLCASAMALSACAYWDGPDGRYVHLDAPIQSVQTEHKTVHITAPPGTTVIYGESLPVPDIDNQNYPRPYPHPHNRYPGLRSLIRTHGGQCLDIDQSHANRRLITYACHGRGNQQFVFDGRRFMVNGMCLDVAGENRNAGAEVIAYPCNGQINQTWYYDGRNIRSAINGFCLDAGKSDNRVRMYRCDGTTGQQFFR